MKTTILLSIIILTFGIAGICIKILFQKNGEFSGTCASNNPFFNKTGEKCGYCGVEPGLTCKKDEKLLAK